MLFIKGPKCWTLEGSPRYRGGTVVQFAQVQLVYIIVATWCTASDCDNIASTSHGRRSRGGWGGVGLPTFLATKYWN